MPGGKLQKSFKKVRTKAQIYDTFLDFFGEKSAKICKQLVQRLKQIRYAVKRSTFFKTHEVI